MLTVFVLFPHPKIRRYTSLSDLGELTEIARTKKSIIYRGIVDGQTVAIKQIPISSLTTQQCVEHVTNERNILNTLTEAHVIYACTFFGTLKTDSAIYLVMELIDGELLTNFLKLNDDVDVRSIFKQIVDILSDLHSKGILYRDLKLTNLIHTGNAIRLIDYGHSKIIGREGRTMSICGTVHAMAPELVTPSEGGYSFEIDLWALGILLFELCEYRAPFGYMRTEADFLESPESLVFRQTHDTELQDLIKRLLTVPVTDRFTLEDVKRHPWVNRIVDDNSFWNNY